jgi:hypothetical protein
MQQNPRNAGVYTSPRLIYTEHPNRFRENQGRRRRKSDRWHRVQESLFDERAGKATPAKSGSAAACRSAAIFSRKAARTASVAAISSAASSSQGLPNTSPNGGPFELRAQKQPTSPTVDASGPVGMPPVRMDGVGFGAGGGDGLGAVPLRGPVADRRRADRHNRGRVTFREPLLDSDVAARRG